MGSRSSRDASEKNGAPQDGIAFPEFKTYFDLIRPLLRLMGIQAETPEGAFEAIRRIPEEKRPPLTVEDARKAHFAKRGWILYRYPNSDLVDAAFHHIEAGRFDEAEQILVGHYDNTTVIKQMKRLERNPTFRGISSMAEKALKAHMQGRRQESVPYTLALTDRLVHQAYLDHHHDTQEGPDRTTQARAWDAFADQTFGLKQLKEYAKAGRERTDPSQREGLLDSIVQLMEEPYTDELTIAKAWSALFSAGEWAIQLERTSVQT